MSYTLYWSFPCSFLAHWRCPQDLKQLTFNLYILYVSVIHYTNTRSTWLHDKCLVPEQMGPHGPGDLSAGVVQSTVVASENRHSFLTQVYYGKQRVNACAEHMSQSSFQKSSSFTKA